jgi:hypothetical protein
MLPSVNSLSSNILALPPTTDITAGMTSLVGVISDFMDQVQGGATGTPGIFTLANSLVITALSELTPVADSSWISGFANALESGITAAIITPGTVTNPAWSGSGNLDVATLPTGAATITTISAAKAALMSGLASATAGNNPAVPFAQAISDCTLAFVFTCIGLGPPPTEAPTPIPVSAE